MILSCLCFLSICFVTELLKSHYLQGLGPYSAPIKKVEKEIKDLAKKINDLCGMCTLSVAQVLGLL